MSKNTHTPGPWDATIKIAGVKDHPVLTRTGLLVARIPNKKPSNDYSYRIETNDSRSVANARLIAAAPEMLAALENLANRCNGHLGRNPYGVPEFEEALRAVAKATGFKGDWMDAVDYANSPQRLAQFKKGGA